MTLCALGHNVIIKQTIKHTTVEPAQQLAQGKIKYNTRDDD